MISSKYEQHRVVIRGEKLWQKYDEVYIVCWKNNRVLIEWDSGYKDWFNASDFDVVENVYDRTIDNLISTELSAEVGIFG